VPPAIRRSLADPVPRNARVCNAFALKNRTLDDVRRTTTALIKRLGWREGRACMDEMIRVEARPNVIVCSALITACGRDGDADEALAVFEEMRAMGIEPDVHAFSALIWACAKGEHPEKALEIFQEMRDEGRIKPNAYTFNSLLMACAKLGHADKAVWAFNTMQDAGVRPDDATYDALIAACEKQGRADLSSEALEDAVAFKVYQEALGYDPKSGILDFHAGPIVTNPASLSLSRRRYSNITFAKAISFRAKSFQAHCSSLANMASSSLPSSSASGTSDGRLPTSWMRMENSTPEGFGVESRHRNRNLEAAHRVWNSSQLRTPP
jgi:pentatricopeptide repeat protein